MLDHRAGAEQHCPDGSDSPALDFCFATVESQGWYSVGARAGKGSFLALQSSWHPAPPPSPLSSSPSQPHSALFRACRRSVVTASTWHTNAHHLASTRQAHCNVSPLRPAQPCASQRANSTQCERLPLRPSSAVLATEAVAFSSSVHHLAFGGSGARCCDFTALCAVNPRCRLVLRSAQLRTCAGRADPIGADKRS